MFVETDRQLFAEILQFRIRGRDTGLTKTLFPGLSGRHDMPHIPAKIFEGFPLVVEAYVGNCHKTGRPDYWFASSFKNVFFRTEELLDSGEQTMRPDIWVRTEGNPVNWHVTIPIPIFSPPIDNHRSDQRKWILLGDLTATKLP